MELDALKFTVETTALDDAITKVGTLQLAVKKLGSDTGSQTARQAAKEQAQITLDQVKAETALIEARGKQARAIENLNSPQEKLTKSVRDSNAVLERQEKIYENMINYGLSKGQASTLAMAQAQDIAAESAQKLVDVMKDTRKYIGGDTFDKSTAGMTAMQNRYETLLIAAKNYADGSVLNIRQAQDLALDTERLAAKNQLLGISGAEAVASINSMTAAFKALAIQENEQSRANDAHAALIKKNSEAMALAERERVAAHLNSGQVLFENNQLRLKQDQQTNKAIMNEMAAYYKAIEAQDLAHSKALLKTGKAQVDTTGNAAVALFIKDQEAKAKAVAKSANDQVKALAKADEMLARLQNRTKEMSNESPVSATAANQLYAYEKALKAAGVGATEATARLSVFRAEQQKVSQLARSEETLRMQHLSRALAPQVTDVTVGLMTGQNPFTVFLQQGGQIRDQIGLSQVATENLGGVFKDTFEMMGAMVTGVGKALYAFFLTPIGAIVASAAVLALGIYKVAEMTYDFEKSMHLLNTALILSGNQAGITSDSLNGLTKEASKIEGISFSKAAEAMAMLAKTGEVSRDEFVKAAESAVLLEKYAGISVGETVKVYKELSNEPLKALIKINEETASFTSSIIKQVAELERQGEKEAAAELARKSYADATVVAAHNIQDSLQGLSKAMDIATTVGEKMWKVIKGGIGVDTNEAAVKSISEEIARIEASITVKRPGGLDIRLSNPVADRMLATLKEQLTYNQHIVDSDRDRAAWQEKSAADAKKTGEYQLELNKSITSEEKKRREIARIQITSVPTLEEASLNGPEAVRKAIAERDKAIRDIETGKGGPKKAKAESTEAFSINLSNELQQYEKQYGIEIKLQDDFIRQEKARLDNALAAKEITQGEFNARDLAASERGYTDRQALSDKYYSGIIQANEKNISEMVQQYQEWVNQEGGTPKFFEQNEKAVETLRSKIINTNNETAVFLEKIQASAASAKETAFTRYSKQLSTLQGEIRGVTLAYNEYLQSEANLTKQKQAQVALEDKVRFATPEQALAIKAAADETERLTKQVQDYDKQIRASKMSLDASVDIYLEQVSLTGEVTEQTQTLLNKEIERYDLLVKTKGLIESTVSTKVADAASAATTKYQKDQMKALSDSVAGAIEIGLYEGGDAGSKALRKIVEAELRKPITLFIQAVVGSITGSATSSLTGSSSVGDKLGSLGQAFNGAGLGSFAVSQMGQSLGLSSMAGDGMGPPALSGAGEVFSSLPIGGMLTAYQVGGAEGFAMGAASTAIAGAISGMAGATGALTGATAALGAIPGYGWAAMAALSVLGAGGGFTSASSTGYSNKSFSNTGTASDIATTTAGAGNIVDALYAGYAKKAESLGISKAAARFSFSSNTGREGQNPNFTLQASAGGRDYITQTDNPGLFGANEIAMSDANMQLQANRAILTALQGSEMPKYLKGAFDSLVVGSMDTAAIDATFEAASALKLFHDQLQLLPFEPLKDLSYTATEALKAFSGGLAEFGANLGTYYDKFYSTEEKNTVLLNNTRKAFEDLGLVLPDINDKTRANYRAMVEELSAKDLSISKNAAAYAGVLQLADSVDKLAPALDKTSTAIVDTVKILQDATNEAIATNNKLLQDKLQKATDQATASMSALTKSVQAQKDANNTLLTSQSDVIQSTLDGVSSSISKLKDLSNSLKSTLDSMRITGSEGDYRVQAQYQISQALQTARTGGGLPLDGQLTSALSTVSKPSENLFGSFEDYARDFYRTANDISDLNELTTKQLTADEVTQGILNKQLKEIKSGFDTENKALDDILKNAQLQLDAANGLDVTIKTVTESLKSFGDAILKLTAERATQDLSTSRGVTYTKEDILAAVKASLEAGGSVADIYKAAALKFGVGASTITQATTGSGLVGFNQTPTKYSPEEILAAVKASLSQGATVADIYKAAYDKFGVTTAQVNSAVQGQGLSGFTTGAATGTQFSQDQMAAWLSQASAAGWSVAEMYNRALSDYGVSNSTLAQVGHAVGIPGFAVGTNYVPYDMTANIHKGERIIPAADNLMLMNTLSRVSYNQQGSNDSELKEELKDMKLLLKSALDKIADNTKQSAELLDAVTAGGNAMLTEAA